MMFLKRLCLASSALMVPALSCSLTREWSSETWWMPLAEEVAAAVAHVGDEGESAVDQRRP